MIPAVRPVGLDRRPANLAAEVGVASACRALRLPRSALYRHRAARRVCSSPVPAPATPVRRPPLALSEHERHVVLDVLNCPRFANCAPAPIHAQLLDQGTSTLSSASSAATVVGWTVAEQESAELAEQLIADSAAKENIEPSPCPCMPIAAAACAASRWRRCCAILASQNHTAALTFLMTIPIQMHGSRP
jgi:hypothetical protein